MTDKPTLMAALAAALPELESAKKNKANPAFKSKYADLAAVIEAVEPIAKHGLWFRQHMHENEHGAMVETFYIHASGEEKSAGCVFMPATKRDAQGFGSALTYARRYGLQTAFGLATEDDDGNAAVKASRNAPEPAPEPPAKREVWDTPIKNRTALHKALTALDRELAGCGDSEMVYGLTATQEWKDFVATATEHAPHYLRGGEPAPPEFIGLLTKAERMVAEFDGATANHMADLGRV